MGGIDLLNKTLKELEDKKGKAAKKQTEKIRKYIKEEDIKQYINLPAKIKLTKFLRIKGENKKVYRHINDDGTIDLDKQPTIILVKFDDKQLKALEELNIQCLIYDFKYDANKQGLIISCENCYYAFTFNNKFCELMIKAVRENRLGLYPPLYNKEWK